jgi:hypothetical protein
MLHCLHAIISARLSSTHVLVPCNHPLLSRTAVSAQRCPPSSLGQCACVVSLCRAQLQSCNSKQNAASTAQRLCLLTCSCPPPLLLSRAVAKLLTSRPAAAAAAGVLPACLASRRPVEGACPLIRPGWSRWAQGHSCRPQGLLGSLRHHPHPAYQHTRHRSARHTLTQTAAAADRAGHNDMPTSMQQASCSLARLVCILCAVMCLASKHSMYHLCAPAAAEDGLGAAVLP